jgi:transcriptional regulator with XRE-family HTH domain
VSEVREHDKAGDVRKLPIPHEGAERSKTDGMDGEELERHEKFLIARRRLNETQKQVAEKYGLTRNNYMMLEKGTKEFPDIPEPKVTKLLDYEKCMIYRRRCGWSQEKLSAESGLSRNWIRQMECGLVSCEQLIWFWEC